MMQKVESSLTWVVLEAKLPADCMSVIEKYMGTKDPLDHLGGYRSQRDLLDTQDTIKCKAFPTILAGSARILFSKLKPYSISNFKELRHAFVSNFIVRRHQKMPTIHLLLTPKKESKSL